MFKGWFNQPIFADLCLVLRTSRHGSHSSSDLATSDPSSKRRCPGLSPDDLRSFQTHQLVLASSSPVIRAMLLRAKELRGLQAVGAGLSVRLLPVECSGSVCLLATPPALQLTYLQPEILELPMEQEELLACEVLFRSMYSGNLTVEVRSALSSEQGAGVSRVILLVQVYRLADRLEVCTDQCAEAISALSSADCASVDAANSVFLSKWTAPALVEHVTIKALLKKCLSQVVARFGVIRRVLRNNSLRKEFKQLDFLTVLAFFQSDDLEVVSENDILTLMGMWMGEDWANLISKEELGDFWSVFGLGGLTTSFITKLTVVAPWLSVDPVVLGDAAAWMWYRDTDPVRAASMQKRLQSTHGNSGAWFWNHRKYCEVRGFKKMHRFSAGGLAKLLTSVQHTGAVGDVYTMRGTQGTFSGYDFFPTLFVQLVSTHVEKTFVMSVGFEVRRSDFISKGGPPILVHVKATCSLGEGKVSLGKVEDFVDENHAWELARMSTSDNFSCL